MTASRRRNEKSPSRSGILLGIGLGGFVDGILLHQILQWHNMLSHVLPPVSMENMKTNMVADGLFHAFVWLITLAGILLLRRAADQPAKKRVPSFLPFTGQLIFGWGLFNLIEGMVDHQILGIHYVREVPNYTVYNLTFLAVGGLLLMLIGWFMMRIGRAMDYG
jgi:uncharacterized membrane protein